MSGWKQFDRRSLVFAAALLAWIGVAYSQPKPQPQNKSGTLGTQQSASQPTPAPQPLSQEQISKAVADGINAAAKEYETRHPAPPPDNSGWWFNFWLVVFTGGLVVVGAGQCYLIFGTLRTAQRATEAADLSAQAAVAIELPFIRASTPDELTRVENIGDDDGGVVWDVETPELPEFSRLYELKFRNIGRTTAAPTKLELGWNVALTLPAEGPVYTYSRSCEHDTVILGNGELYTLECIKFCIVLSQQERDAIAANVAVLWVFAALTYRDFLDKPHTGRFCWRWGCQDGVGLYHFYRDEHTPSRYTTKS